MGMTLSQAKKLFSREVYEKLVKRYSSDRRNGSNKNTRGAANLERAACYESMEKKKGARFNSPVYINVLSVRKRLADRDGISAKAAIDGLRHCGILQNDTTKQIKDIRYPQQKCRFDRGEEEYTEITITREVVENG